MAQPVSGSTEAMVAKYIAQLMTIAKTKRKGTGVTPYQVVSGSGPAYYMAPQARTHIKVNRGSEILVLPLGPDEQGRFHVVDLHGRYFLIPEDEIINLGFN